MIVPLEKPGTPEDLVHFGVRGMKWGIRKQRASNLQGLLTKPIVRKTANGDTFTLSPNSPTKLHKTMAALSGKYEKSYNSTSYLSIKDKNGKSLGSASLWLKGEGKNKELYLNWIQIDKSERGKGYATVALKSAEQHGKKMGLKRMLLDVPGNAPDARHIYDKMGFKPTGKVSGGKGDIWGGLTEMEYKFKK